MIVLVILGSLVLLLFLLLLPRVSVEVRYRDGALTGTARYLFLRYRFSPEDLLADKDIDPKKKAKQDKKKAKKAKQKPEEDEKKEKDSALDTAKMVWDLAKSSVKALGIIRRHTVLSRVALYISVGGDDAHKTALAYSHTRMAVMAALDVLGLLFVLKKPKVGILPDFRAPRSRYDLALRIGIRPLFVVAAALSVAGKFLQVILADRNKQNKNSNHNNKKQQIKGGKQHERATSH